MSDTQKFIKNAKTQYSSVKNVETNAPIQYADRQTQYLKNRTNEFIARRAYLSSDFVEAEVQGLDTTDFYKWVKTKIRMSSISAQGIAATTDSRTDDFRKALLVDRRYNYLPIGALIKSLGDTWLVTNPSNMDGVGVDAVISRCNTSYNTYDPYGNVITEPIIVSKYSMVGTDNSVKSNFVSMNGYFNVQCQQNENTRKLGLNKRIIVGNNPYNITGFTDFIQEFTGDRNSCHLLSFVMHIEEPKEYDDLTKNFIANGNNYKFEIQMAGLSTIVSGATTQLQADYYTNYVEDLTTLSPTILWTSSDESIAQVDENGVVTGISAGNCEIIATLKENPNIFAKYAMEITELITIDHIEFLDGYQTSITQYESESYSAFYYENGQKTSNPITYTFGNADTDTYEVEYNTNNEIIITCLKYSRKLLHITASYEGDLETVEKTIKIRLRGY